MLSTNELTKGPLVISLPSASPANTRQRGSLYRVPPNTLGKGPGKGARGELLCRLSLCGHSALAPSSLPGAVTMTFLCRVLGDTRQYLLSAR
jgi:hypothetical protein